LEAYKPKGLTNIAKCTWKGLVEYDLIYDLNHLTSLIIDKPLKESLKYLILISESSKWTSHLKIIKCKNLLALNYDHIGNRRF
jgi:hypothetical protein